MLRGCKQYLSGDLPEGPFRPFHKSFSDFLLEDQLNIDYHIDGVSMHRRISNYYWSNYKDSWEKCDDYGLNALATHMYAGKHFRRLWTLISQNWMHARIGRHHFDGFIADLDLALSAALSQENGDGLVESIRCVLIRTSFNSVSRNYPPELVARAFDRGLLTYEQVLSLAANLKESAAVAFWAAILKTHKLDPPWLARAEKLALGQAEAIVGDGRAHAFVTLAGSLEGEERTLAVRQGLQAARQIVGASDRTRALTKLAYLGSTAGRGY